MVTDSLMMSHARARSIGPASNMWIRMGPVKDLKSSPSCTAPKPMVSARLRKSVVMRSMEASRFLAASLPGTTDREWGAARRDRHVLSSTHDSDYHVGESARLPQLSTNLLRNLQGAVSP